MTGRRLPLALLGMLLLAFGASMVMAANELPERVATHFDFAGRANGWLSRPNHLLFMTAFGVGLPLFLVGVISSIRWLPAGMVNIPHRDYWLSAERRGETSAWLAKHALWLACLTSGLIAALNVMVTLANRDEPAVLPAARGFGVVAMFLVGIAVWVTVLCRHFRRPEDIVAAGPSRGASGGAPSAAD